MHMASRIKTFSDKSTFSSANDRLVLVYRPWEEHYNFQCVSVSTNSRYLFFVWARILHCIERQLDGLQFMHILKTIMVPYIRLVCANRVIQFQQDHYCIHVSNLVQGWLLVQAYVECSNWPPKASGMSPIDNILREVKKTMQISWPDLPPKNSDTLWTTGTENWDKYASSQH
jgi:hypothetical protein